MDISKPEEQTEDPQWGEQLQQALTRDDAAEVLRLFRGFGVTSIVDNDAMCPVIDKWQLTPNLHYALNYVMRHHHMACAKVLVDLVADVSEINSVSGLICPEKSSDGIDDFLPATPSHERRTSHLHVSTCLGCPALVKMLLDKGANLLVLDSDLNTPLITLARCCPVESSLPTLEILLRGRAWVWKKSYANLLNSRGLSALHYAVGRARKDVVNFLIEECGARADPWRTPHPGLIGRFVGFSPLHIALMNNRHWAVGRLLAAGADVCLIIPNFTDSLMQMTIPHARVLSHCDCGCGFSRYLHIAPPLFVSEHAVFLNPTLGLAAFLDDEDSVEALVTAGADVNERDCKGYTPLCYSVLRSNYRTVLTLLTLEADPGIVPTTRGSLLHMAFAESATAHSVSAHCTLETVNCLIEELIDTEVIGINVRDVHGYTPLILACRRGYFLTVPLLVISGSSLSSLDTRGRSALFFATRFAETSERNRLMMKCLIHFGAACLEPEPYHRNGDMHTWRCPALLALYHMDALSIFLLYKGGALRSHRLVRLLLELCYKPRDNWLWSGLFIRFPVSPDSLEPNPRNNNTNRSGQKEMIARSSHGQDSHVHEKSTYTIAEMENVFGNDQRDWDELLGFCGLPHDFISLLEHDECDFLAETSSEESTDFSRVDHQSRILGLTYHFLQKVGTNVPTLFDLCRWAVREAIGDDPWAWKRATVSLNLPSVIMSHMMIGYTQTP